MNGPLDLVLASDQRVDVALPGLAVEIYAIGIERLLALGDYGVFGHVLVGAVNRARPALTGGLSDAVRDVVDGIQPGHIVKLQEVNGVRLALGEHCHQHIGPGYLLAARRLDVDDGALHDALEADRRLRLGNP